tara:strand:+ start:4779 stop:5468 length:690 start_codon:yes stop_codon:yes gene_type:complete
MKILALGAHPDDIEIFMYGLVCIYKNEGNQVFTMVATDGAKGGSQQDEFLIKQRAEETTAGLKNLSTPIFLNIPDSELGEDSVHQKIIKESILNIMPDLIITHSKHDYHADHRSLSRLTSNAVSHYIPILFCDTLMGVNFQPNYYIDITDHFEKKKEAILKHKSQKPQRFVDLIKLMNSYRAAQCNAPQGRYAEAYSFTSSFPFTDIRKILPSSLKLRPFHIDNHNGFL